ncbi:MAG: M64 family metallopeptidase [Bacteroidota bacterium]
MKTIYSLFILFALSCSQITAQVFEVDTILYNGDDDNRINIVFLGDGYQASELPKYNQDVVNTVDDLFSTTPFIQYRDYFNVFAINVPSLESGASHPGTALDEPSSSNQPTGTVVNNFFNSTFDFAGIHRLVVAQDGFAISNVLADNFPNYDQVFILVNSEFYGGSGGASAISTTHVDASEIAIHEIGHSFANLADEYYAGDFFSAELANMTQETNPAFVRWKNWYGDQGVGIYQHCCSGNSANWYRPHQNCKMRILGVPFCAVCTETFVETIHDLVSPIDDYTPSQLQLTNQGQDLIFKADLIYPDPNTLAITWLLNGNLLTTDVDSISLSSSLLETGSNQLTIMVDDQTPLSRADLHTPNHLFSVNWEIEKTTTSIQSIGQERKLHWNVYPNPTKDRLQVNYELDQGSEVQIVLYDQLGQLIQQSPSTRQASGEHDYAIDMSQLPTGNYRLQLLIDGIPFSRPIVKME